VFHFVNVIRKLALTEIVKILFTGILVFDFDLLDLNDLNNDGL